MRFTYVLLALFSLGACTKSTSAPQAVVPAKATAPASTAPFKVGVISLQGLSDAERAEFIEVTEEELCPCNCAMTFKGCLSAEKVCEPAKLLADWSVEMIKAGYAVEFLAPALAKEIGAFRSTPKIINTKGYGTKGSKNPKVTIVEFADFQCGHCKTAAEALDILVKSDPKNIQVVYKHFPLAGHPFAKQAAKAVEAAAAQGQFWPMHHALFSDQVKLSDMDILQHARAVGLDEKTFLKHISSAEVSSKVAASRKEGETLGIQGTPALFFNNRPYNLSYDMRALKLRVAMEKARTQSTCQ